MARDEALLDLVGERDGCAAFRTYGWVEPTLSLGYFQHYAAAEGEPRWRGIPMVRRSTGGGAILHDREITYALAVPRSHPLGRGGVDLYRAVHAAIAGLLENAGVVARRRGTVDPAADPSGRPLLCFADRDPEDLVVAGHKVVGSAQRRRSGAVLQHGSVLLARSPFARELPGLTDLWEADGLVVDWAERLGASLPGALGFRAEPGAWTDRLEDRAVEVEHSVYRDAARLRRR